MIITGDDAAGIRTLQQFFSQNFEIKDRCTLSCFHDLELASGLDKWCPSHAKYASDFLSRAGLTDRKSVTSPLEPNLSSLLQIVNLWWMLLFTIRVAKSSNFLKSLIALSWASSSLDLYSFILCSNSSFATSASSFYLKHGYLYRLGQPFCEHRHTS